jgi:hypothetical protein
MLRPAWAEQAGGEVSLTAQARQGLPVWVVWVHF